MSDEAAKPLERAHTHALRWLESLESRGVPPGAQVAELVERLGRELPVGPTDPAEVVDLLAEACEPGLTAMPSGRFFGFVIGGTHPAALAADWLTSAWDQNAGLRTVTPAHTAVDDIVEAWVTDLLGLPSGSAVGCVTGGTMANFTCLAAARDAMLGRVGWDVASRGLVASPGVRVLVGAERHDSVDLVLRYLGLGAPEVVAADDQGRLDVTALETALATDDGRPAVVVLQAGNVHSGAFDPFADAISVSHDHGAWVHVDGAFGLFAGASPRHRHLVAGYEGADSWATDAHKTLNVPYDCGLAVVRDPVALRAAMSMAGPYLVVDAAGDPFEKVPELSRRGPGLRGLGRVALPGPAGRGRPGRSDGGSCPGLRRRHRGHCRRRGPQRRGVHAGVRSLRRRRADPRRGTADAGGRHGLDHRFDVARPSSAAHLGQQLVDDVAGRRTHAGGAAERRGRVGAVSTRSLGSGSCASQGSPPEKTPSTA